MNRTKRFTVLLLVLLSFSCSSLAHPNNITYLLPEGFTGGVIIVYNQPDGITLETNKDGTIVFHVPKDGLIKVKEPLKKDAYNFSYYFVDEKGNRTPIEYLYLKNSGGNPNDPTSRNMDEVTQEEANNTIFALAHTTSNFNVGGEKVYIHNFLIEKPAVASRTLTQTEYRIFDIQKELLIKEKALQEKQ